VNRKRGKGQKTRTHKKSGEEGSNNYNIKKKKEKKKGRNLKGGERAAPDVLRQQ